MKFDEVLPLYVLDAVTDDERIWIENHIRTHPEALEQLNALQADVMILNESAEPIEPAPHVKEQLMSRIAAESDHATATPTRAVRQSKPTTQESWWDRLRAGFALPAFAGAAALAALMAFLWVGSLRQQLETQGQFVAEQQSKVVALESEVKSLQAIVGNVEAERNALLEQTGDLESEMSAIQSDLSSLTAEKAALEAETAALAEENNELGIQLERTEGVAELEERIAALEAESAELQRINLDLQEQLEAQDTLLAIYRSPELETIQVAGTGEQTQAIGHLSADTRSQTAVFNAWRLEPVDHNLWTYQLWLINDEGAAGVGVFDLHEDGWGTVTIATELLSNYNAVGLTVEPRGGSDVPTTDVVMLGNR